MRHDKNIDQILETHNKLKNVLIMKGLTNREADVALLIATGLSNIEIGKLIFVTEKTVKFHFKNILKRMVFKDRAQLIVWCLPHMSWQKAK